MENASTDAGYYLSNVILILHRVTAMEVALQALTSEPLSNTHHPIGSNGFVSLSPPYPNSAPSRTSWRTLDDKIELNRRMNDTLEAMARALFKSWFVDFDPVRAKMEGRDPDLPKHIADLFPDLICGF